MPKTSNYIYITFFQLSLCATIFQITYGAITENYFLLPTGWGTLLLGLCCGARINRHQKEEDGDDTETVPDIVL